MPAEEQVALVRRACAGSALQWVAVSQDLRLLLLTPLRLLFARPEPPGHLLWMRWLTDYHCFHWASSAEWHPCSWRPCASLLSASWPELSAALSVAL